MGSLHAIALPCNASPQPESGRPIIQSMIVSGPGSFQTGRASRDPGSRPPDRLAWPACPCLASAWPLAFVFDPEIPSFQSRTSIFSHNHTRFFGRPGTKARTSADTGDGETLSHCGRGPTIPSCYCLSIHPSIGCRATSRLSVWLRECRPGFLVLLHAIGSSAISSSASECCWQQSALQGTTAVSLPVWTAKNKRLRHVRPTAVAVAWDLFILQEPRVRLFIDLSGGLCRVLGALGAGEPLKPGSGSDSPNRCSAVRCGSTRLPVGRRLAGRDPVALRG